MKKILLASAAVVMTAGVASAAVELSGDGRMGIVYDGTDWAFTSRARVKFTLSGTADNGLEFGGSFRADNAGAAAGGTAGSVFVKGAFGTISMGDVDGAAQAAVGQVDGVGLTGLGDHNEILYVLGGSDPSMLYEYSMNAISFYLSLENPAGGNEAYGVGVKYATDTWGAAVGYENDNGFNHSVLGGWASFSGVTVKATYGDAAVGDGDQYGLSVSGTFSGVGVTVYTAEGFDGVTQSGLGASYDLGGGLSLVGGVVDNGVDTVADFGVSMSF
jgi:outer membrane protein OmpU